MMESVRLFLKSKYAKRLAFVAIYAVVYFAIFHYLEVNVVPKYILDTSIDEAIPFIPAFIIPYLSWFPFLGFTEFYMIFIQDDDEAMMRFVKAFTTGIVVFLICSILFPNGQNLRPVITENTPFYPLLHMMYSGDSTTNIFPSLHVFLGVTCGTALLQEADFCKKHFSIRIAINVLVILIVLSTMFIKAHSVLDVISALVLNVFCYEVYYDTTFADKRTRVFNSIF